MMYKGHYQTQIFCAHLKHNKNTQSLPLITVISKRKLVDHWAIYLNICAAFVFIKGITYNEGGFKKIFIHVALLF